MLLNPFDLLDHGRDEIELRLSVPQEPGAEKGCNRSYAVHRRQASLRLKLVESSVA